VTRVPPMHDVQRVKITFEFEPEFDGDVVTETVWAVPMGNRLYRLDNVPFFAFAVSFDDVVIANECDGQLWFAGVARLGGHSTYRVAPTRPDDAASFQHAWTALAVLGCTYEKANDALYAIDVPPAADIRKVIGALMEGESAGIWQYEEGHLAHRLG
jgi:hypothetical protein